MCTVSNNIETSRLNYYKCPHSFTPLASKAQIPQLCGRDYTKETGISRQHSAAQRGNGANRKTRHNNTVTSRQYGRRAFYVSGEISCQGGDALDLGKLGGTFSLIFFYFLSISALALANFAIRYTHIGLLLYYGTTARATLVFFLCTMQVNVRGVYHRLVSTMSDCLR